MIAPFNKTRFNIPYQTLSTSIPVINIISYTKSKISDEINMNVSTVVFQSSQDLLQWEARADGQGQGQGLLVDNGGSAIANTNISFDVDYTELTQGDKTYVINIYGQNTSGVWSTYG